MCLTDMWKATGSDKSQRPAKWLASEQARTFAGFLNDCAVVRNADISLVVVERGAGGGATWAHWQLAFASVSSPARSPSSSPRRCARVLGAWGRAPGPR